jgi:hypothetical protein
MARRSPAAVMAFKVGRLDWRRNGRGVKRIGGSVLQLLLDEGK